MTQPPRQNRDSIVFWSLPTAAGAVLPSPSLLVQCGQCAPVQAIQPPARQPAPPQARTGDHTCSNQPG